VTDAYDTAVLASTPFAYWKLEESSGTSMVDSSGNGRNGSYVNTPQLHVPGPVVGWWGVNFGGGSQYASAAINLSATKLASFECFFAVQNNVKQGAVWQFGDNADTTVGMAFCWYDNNDGLVNVGSDNGGGTPYNITRFNQPPLISWHHLIAVIDRTKGPGSVSVYVDGALAPQGQSQFALHNNVFGNLTFYLGRTPSLAKFLPVVISRMSIYDYLLTSGQVQAHWAGAQAVGPLVVSSAAGASVGDLDRLQGNLLSVLSTIQTLINFEHPPIISSLSVLSTSTVSGTGFLVLTGRGVSVLANTVPVTWGMRLALIEGEFYNRLVQLSFAHLLSGGLSEVYDPVIDQYGNVASYFFTGNVPYRLYYDVGVGCTVDIKQLG
jgi:hypothetical protein